MDDDSPVGTRLRTLLAEAAMVAAAVNDPRGRRRLTAEARDAALARGLAGQLLLPVLAGEPRLAVAEMLKRRRSSAWRDRLAADLAGVQVPQEVLRDEEQRAAQAAAGPAAIRVDQLAAPWPGGERAGPGGRGAVRLGGVRPPASDQGSDDGGAHS